MPKNTGFPKATYRFDPYHNYRFRVKWDGKYVAGVSKVSGLTRSTQVGAGPRRMSEQQDYQAITLDRGVTHDVAFEQWANKVWYYHNTTIDEGSINNQDVSLKDFRKDIILEMYNEAGQKVLAYKIYRCWPSEYEAMPELDGNGNVVAILRLKLENEGWECDTSVKEPI